MESKHTINQLLVAGLVSAGYVRHPLPITWTGILLLHPEFSKHEGEVRDTLPMALRYAKLGHLIVLTAPQSNNGISAASPDGFLDEATQTIEFKRCLGKGEESIYRNLSKSSKKGLTVVRAIWIDDAVPMLTIAKVLARKYRCSARVDQVHIHWKDCIYTFSRQLFSSEGEAGIRKELLK